MSVISRPQQKSTDSLHSRWHRMSVTTPVHAYSNNAEGCICCRIPLDGHEGTDAFVQHPDQFRCKDVIVRIQEGGVQYRFLFRCSHHFHNLGNRIGTENQVQMLVTVQQLLSLLLSHTASHRNRRLPFLCRLTRNASPKNECSFNSGFSRIEQVFTIMRSAWSISSVWA